MVADKLLNVSCSMRDELQGLTALHYPCLLRRLPRKFRRMQMDDQDLKGFVTVLLVAGANTEARDEMVTAVQTGPGPE